MHFLRIYYSVKATALHFTRTTQQKEDYNLLRVLIQIAWTAQPYKASVLGIRQVAKKLSKWAATLLK